jgi:hypothetical protein
MLAKYALALVGVVVLLPAENSPAAAVSEPGRQPRSASRRQLIELVVESDGLNRADNHALARVVEPDA